MLEQAKLLRDAGERARRHDPTAARQNYEEAVALLRTEDDPLGLAHTVRHLGDVHRENHEPSLAEPSYVEALALYRAHPNPPPLDYANALRAAAVLQSSLGQHAQARPLWAEAGELYAACGIEAGVAECARRVAQT